MHATSGNVNLNANWDPNTVNITYYSDNSEFTTGSCTYDQSLLIPQTEPQKTGYTFGGWRVRSAAINNQNIVASWDQISETILQQGTAWSATEFSGTQRYLKNNISGLNPGEWAVSFGDGITVYGIASCNTTEGSSSWAGGWLAEDEYMYNCDAKSANTFTNTVTGGYCWCFATGYKQNDSDKKTVTSSKWVYPNSESVGEAYCGNNCARDCAKSLYGGIGYDLILFNIEDEEVGYECEE